MSSSPEKLHLIPDGYHLQHVGSLSSGDLFWIDIQLSWEPKHESTRDFVCVYVFTKDGALKSHDIVDLGLRSEKQKDPDAVIAQWMNEHTDARKSDIWVRPFTVNIQGLVFGLEVQTEDGEVLVEAMPGNTMMFYEPWDERLYDT